MVTTHPLPAQIPVRHAFHATLRAFPIACFSLTLLTDIAYMQTSELMWLHFSEWLLFVGCVVGALALLSHGIDWLIRRYRPSWLAVLGGIVVLLLATINSFVHTNDGWTAVVPWGLTLSALTIVAMIITAWLGRAGVRRDWSRHHV